MLIKTPGRIVAKPTIKGVKLRCCGATQKFDLLYHLEQKPCCLVFMD